VRCIAAESEALTPGFTPTNLLSVRRRSSTPRGPSRPWLLLFHRLPSRPHYLRIQVGRELKKLGALPLRNAVYVVPATAELRETLGALLRRILEKGGDALVTEATFVAGLSDAVLHDRFRAARDTEYAAIRDAAARAAGGGRRDRELSESQRRALARELESLRARLAEVVARDWFGAGGREAAAGTIALAEDRLAGVEEPAPDARKPLAPPRGAIWVTRTGVMVDRIASAWLIRRFIDRDARFRFTSGRGDRGRPGDLRFDMAGGAFTHEGDLCTFEVLLQRFAIRDSALGVMGEWVHDLDLEDGRFGHPETRGLGRAILGIALATRDDVERLARGAVVLDGLYESFRTSLPARRRTSLSTRRRKS